MADINAVHIRPGFFPGVIGNMVAMHAEYYAAEWNFGLYFESQLAMEIAAFAERFDDRQDCLLCALFEDKLAGCIAVDSLHLQERGAQLRWFMLDEPLRGTGVGKTLLQRALAFCRQRHYQTIFLHRFDGLQRARQLYDKAGFRVTDEHHSRRWGTSVNEQEMELRL